MAIVPSAKTSLSVSWNFTTREYGLHCELISDHIKSQGGSRDFGKEVVDGPPIESSELPDFTIPAVCIPEDTPLVEDESVQSLLENALWHLPENVLLDLKESIYKPRDGRILRLPVPALRTDNAADYRTFCKSLWDPWPRHHEQLRTAQLPVEPVDNDLDEGILFPKSAQIYANMCTLEVEDDDMDEAVDTSDGDHQALLCDALADHAQFSLQEVAKFSVGHPSGFYVHGSLLTT
jgi:hypothetical protein